MFKNEFQGGSHFEVFTAQGKDPIAHWKLTGSSGIRKEFDKSVKSYVYILDGSAATTKIQIPRDARHSLGLMQRYVVLQLLVPKGTDFSVDLGIQDQTGSKRRLNFSTAIRETNSTPLHSKVPLGLVQRDLWLNLCFDLVGFVTETWHGQTYKSLESICLSANCRLRRIFTLKIEPPDTSSDDDIFGATGTNSGEIESIPKQCQLAPDILQSTQIINVMKILCYEGKRKVPDIVLDPSSSTTLEASLNASKSGESYHIAFGTKMVGQKKEKREGSGNSSKPPSARHKSDSSGEQGLSTSRQSSASSTGRPDSGPKANLRKMSLTDRRNSDSSTGMDDKNGVNFVKPHPPRGPSADRIRRKPRVKSAGKERGSAGSERSSAGADRTPHSLQEGAGAGDSSSFVDGSSELESKSKPRSVATEEEEAGIMKSMNDSTRRGIVPKSESESDPSSHNNSAPTVDDSLDDVINTLNRPGGTGPREYEDTDNEGDEEDEEDNEEQVFLYSSKPKSAPRLKKSRKTSHRFHKEKAKASSMVSQEGAGPEEADFTLGQESSEEEESVMTRVLKHHPAARPNDQPTHRNGNSNHKHHYRPHDNLESDNQYGKNRNEGRHQNYPPLKRSPRSPNGNHNLPTPQRANSLLNPSPHDTSSPSPNGVDITRSPGSNSRMSIRKKSLREIPKDDVRLSQQSQKRYSPEKYSMRELTDSCEAAMLQSLRRQTLEDGVPESDEDPRQQQQQQPQQPQPQHSHLHYSDHSLSDTSDDTSMSPIKRPGSRLKVHNYQEEMKGEFLNHSNPRDWGNVFSPPIVLPSQKTCNSLSPSTLNMGNNKDRFPGRKTLAPSTREQGETDEEDELDLLYDPVLNCYFDPRTCKYYELV